MVSHWSLCTEQCKALSNKTCFSYRHSKKTVIYCIVLYCIALRCAALRCVALHCVALRCVALHFIALHCIALHCIVLYCIVLHCIVLYCIVLYCIEATCGTTITCSRRSKFLSQFVEECSCMCNCTPSGSSRCMFTCLVHNQRCSI